MDFAVSGDDRVKSKKTKRRRQDLARELKKTLEHEGVGDTNCNLGP